MDPSPDQELFLRAKVRKKKKVMERKKRANITISPAMNEKVVPALGKRKLIKSRKICLFLIKTILKRAHNGIGCVSLVTPRRTLAAEIP